MTPLFTRSIFFFLIASFVTISFQEEETNDIDTNDFFKEVRLFENPNVFPFRQKRAVKGKPGLFRLILGLAFEQWNETKSTFNQIQQTLNNNFPDANAPTMKPVTTTGEPNATTTTEQPKVSRQEIARILRRNLLGLQKLFQIELNDALNQSEKNIRDFKSELNQQKLQYLS